jgi:ABC-type Na+ efflux pump permease subunit
MVLLAPLFTLLAVGLGITISSRVRDAQSAQQLGSLLVLPVIGVLVAQITGAVTLGVGSILTACMVIAAIDVVLFALAIKLFNRENILIHWR